MKTYFAYSKNEQHQFKAKNISDARHWIINHLDCSQEWTLGQVINPTSKRNTHKVSTVNNKL